jgi:Protein of unknown function (DUF3618)
MGSEQDPLISNPAEEDRRSSSEIKSNIRRTRDRLDDTLEDLNERLSPRALINDVLNWFESRGIHQPGTRSEDALNRGYRNVVRYVKENPIPSLLIGTGIAWLILRPENGHPTEHVDPDSRADDDLLAFSSPEAAETGTALFEKSQNSGIASTLKEKAGQAQEALSSASETLKDKMADIGSGVHGMAVSGGRAVAEGIRQGRRVGSDATQNLQKSYAYSGDRFQEAVEEYPLAIAVGFLGVGLLTGLLLPRTRPEDKLVGEKSDQLIDQVKETGKETLEKAKTVAQQVAKATMEEAERQGITPEAAGERISEMAGKISAVANKAKKEAVRAAEEEQLKPAPEQNQGNRPA